MVTEYNTKLIDYFKRNKIGPSKAIGFFAIPGDLAKANIKGELADLVEAKVLEIDPVGRFHLYQDPTAIGTNPARTIEYRKNDSLLGDIFNEISKRSKYKPILSKDLEHRFDIGGTEVRGTVRVLRRKGEPIVGSNTGYYLAGGTEEVKELISDLESRISSMRETINAIKKRAYDRFGTQMTIDL